MNNFGFCKNTEVLTEDGWIPISKVPVGTKCVSYSIAKDIMELDTVKDVRCNSSTKNVEC